ncbi:hypothetical protein Cgig2_012817 [Carnegiea gigantea]|uniref:Uncharacterized protein n=1 Tax=Carnegiea gigantea TaxID=171969 RepID=A0A9Q1KAC5_9CARY|nr:hypothetical protein Cgig2_012817 [Carnegiea gigantea]
MKDQLRPSPHHKPRRVGTNLSYVALLIVSYVVVLLTASYCIGYLAGLSFSTKDISTFVISKTLSNPQPAAEKSSDRQQSRPATQCADPVPTELVRQTVIDEVYNGESPYEDFNPSHISLSIPTKRIKGWESYGAIYKSLIHKVRPNTIIKFNSFFGASATYMANLTSQLGLKTQILCFDDFHGRQGDLFEDIAMPNGGVMNLDQFMQNVISQNASNSILPVPLSTTVALERLCELGIYGDLIEVDAGHDFNSAWSDINTAYKLLRPGGVLFGHNYFASYYNRGVRQAVRAHSATSNPALLKQTIAIPIQAGRDDKKFHNNEFSQRIGHSIHLNPKPNITTAITAVDTGI